MRKRLNRSICRLGCGLRWAEGNTSSVVFARWHQCALVGRHINATWRRRCGLMSNYFDHLFVYQLIFYPTEDFILPSKRKKRSARSRRETSRKGTFRQGRLRRHYVVDYFVVVDYSIYSWYADITITNGLFVIKTSIVHHYVFVYSVVVTRNSSHRDKNTQSLKTVNKHCKYNDQLKDLLAVFVQHSFEKVYRWLSSVVLLSSSLVCALCLRLYCDSDRSGKCDCNT